jgi:hypothetical protein
LSLGEKSRRIPVHLIRGENPCLESNNLIIFN